MDKIRNSSAKNKKAGKVAGLQFVQRILA